MEPVKKDLILRGEQIYLRPITADDTELAVRWRNQPSVVANFLYRKPITPKDHEDWLANKVFKGLVHQFIVCRNEDDKPLGSAYLQNFDEESRRAEWGDLLRRGADLWEGSRHRGRAFDSGLCVQYARTAQGRLARAGAQHGERPHE